MGRILRFRGRPRRLFSGRAPKGRLPLAAAAVAGMLVGLGLFELLPAGPAVATAPGGVIAGHAVVIDGDTLDLSGTRIRLHGIDAPESAQTCSRDRTEWRCGEGATLALALRIGKEAVACAARDRDRYGRVVAVCRAGGAELNAWMVAEGWALAYRRYSADYVAQEESAAAARRGLWQGGFVPPWEWRRGTRMTSAEPASAPATPACAIKGNVSSRGERIYHVPGGAFYDRTRIDPLKGERWFCGEAEAGAAGWRPSRR